MNKQQQEILQTLRTAAKQDQWNLCRESVAKLLHDLPPEGEITVVTKQIHRYLADFSHTHSQDEAISEALGELSKITSSETLGSQAQVIEKVLDKYWDEPGVSNFRNALKRWSSLHQFTFRSTGYIDATINVLSGIVLAIETHNWGADNPERWRLFFKENPREGIMILAKHWSDPERVRLRESLWTDIANDIGMALSAD